MIQPEEKELNVSTKGECIQALANLLWCDEKIIDHKFERICAYKGIDRIEESEVFKTLNESSFEKEKMLTIGKIMPKKVLTKFGMCLTYNMYSKELFDDTFVADYDDYVHFEDPDIEWSNDQGYFSKFSSDPIRLKKFRENMYAQLFYNLSDVRENSCGNQLLKVIFHPPNEIPTRFHTSFDATFGDETNVYHIAGVQSYRANKNLNILAPEIRQCYYENEKKLKYFKKYSKSHCELECLNDFAKSRSKCSIIDLPRAKSDGKSPADNRCKFRFGYNFGEWEENKDGCKCLPNCNYIDYVITNQSILIQRKKFTLEKYK